MKQRTLITAALALAVALMLAACGSAEDTIDAVEDDLPGGDITSGDGPVDGDLPLGAGPYPVGTLDITVTHPDQDDLVYTISCLGDTATITPVVDGLNEMIACERLGEDAVQTLLVDGPPADRMCTEIYGGPDEARVVGTLDDQAVDTVILRNNGCGIDDWDNVLAGVLPTAVGATG